MLPDAINLVTLPTLRRTGRITIKRSVYLPPQCDQFIVLTKVADFTRGFHAEQFLHDGAFLLPAIAGWWFNPKGSYGRAVATLLATSTPLHVPGGLPVAEVMIELIPKSPTKATTTPRTTAYPVSKRWRGQPDPVAHPALDLGQYFTLFS